MAIQAAIFSNFSGGISADPKIGIRNSQAFLQSMDFRTASSSLSVLPGPVREDAGIIKGLILQEVMAANGVIYAADNLGYVYRRATSGTWSTVGAMGSGAGGMDYRFDADAIYLTNNTTVSLISGVVNGSPTLSPGYFGPSVSTYNNTTNTGFNVNADQEGSTNSTVIGTTIIENSTHSRYFQTDIEPCSQIAVYTQIGGGSSWTLTLHDGNNNVLGTSTVSSGNINSNNWTIFPFSSQIRLYPAPNARTYHFHLTSSGTAPTVASSTTNDLSTCDVRIYADRLVNTRNGLHPMARFLQYELIGNGNYISAWEPISDPPTNSEWVRAQLTVPMEYENCGIAVTNEFTIGAFEKTSSVTGSTPQEGLLIFWDGSSPTYNYFLPVTEGSPQGLHVYANVAYYYAAGAWWAVTSPTTQPVRLRTLPGAVTDLSNTNSLIQVYPNAATTRRGIHLLGWPGQTTNPNVQFGVWSWGSIDKNFPMALGYNYVISTGTQNYSGSNNLQIGMVKSFGDLLHISWRDDLNGGYGIDKVDNTVGVAPTGIWQSWTIDGGYPAKFKEAEYVEAYYSLPAGSTIQLAYQINRSGIWVTDPNLYSTTNLWQGRAGYARFTASKSTDGSFGGEFREIQMQVTIVSAANTLTSPKLFMAGIVYDNRKEDVLV